MPDPARSAPEILSWKVGGMDCASCAATIRGALERLPGVSDVRLSVMSETLTLALDESLTGRETIEKRVAGLGYTTATAPKREPASDVPAACGCCGLTNACRGHDHRDH